MKEKIVTEFLHDIVRKHNLDTYMRNNNNDWDNFISPTQDPWGDIDITQLGRDWLAAAREQHRVTDSGILGEGPF